MYELEYLLETFKKHTEESDKLRKEELDRFKEHKPDAPIPAHFLEEFNFPGALFSICYELNELKKRISS